MMMLRQFLRRRGRIVRGVWNTWAARRGKIYDDPEWWDESFYTKGVSDRQTLGPTKNQIAAKYHYSSVELLILRHLSNGNIAPEGSVVLDIGAGAGHWIDFYRSLGSTKTIGLDVSASSARYLQAKYRNDPDVAIIRGKASETIGSLKLRFNIVSAIGVMFHIADDSEWVDTIEKIGAVMAPNGVLVVSGHFGSFDGVNVQIVQNDHVNKRLRSKQRWKDVLGDAGFNKVRFYRNSAYLRTKYTLPENHVLIAAR